MIISKGLDSSEARKMGATSIEADEHGLEPTSGPIVRRRIQGDVGVQRPWKQASSV